jgi:glyoxylate reductase
VLRPQATTREHFIQECRVGTFDGVVALYRAAITVAGKFDAELVATLPKSLKFICYSGTFTDLNASSGMWVATADTQTCRRWI